jgi:hypothetical protein
MGEITDHSFENLSFSDLMVAVTRRRLREAANDLEAKGDTPPGVTTPEAYGKLGAGFFVAPETRPWPEVYHHQLASARVNPLTPT